VSSLAPFLSPAKYVHAHSVAVAQHTHVLEEFISRLLKQKALNVTKLASMDMPAGRGKKLLCCILVPKSSKLTLPDNGLTP